MDGTLINTEDIYTEVSNELLEKFGKGPMTWDIKIKLQGRPGPEATQIMINLFDLPCTCAEFSKLAMEIQESKWHKCGFLPGALELIEELKSKNIPIALGTSSNIISFKRKTAHLEYGFKHFKHHIVTGDDPRIPPGRGKPHPDIWLACLDSLNTERRSQNLDAIDITECLIFEDGVPGVVSGVAANARVIWIPDVNAVKQLNGSEVEILGNNGDLLTSLHDFDKQKYGL